MKKKEELNYYIKIPTLLIVVGTDICFSIYLKQNDNYVLYATPENFTKDIRNKLKNDGHEHLYIQSKEKLNYNQYLEQNLKHVLLDPTISIQYKGKIIYDHSMDLVQQMFSNANNRNLNDVQFEQISNLVESIFGFISNTNNGLQTLQRLISNSYYDYVHSVNTAIYSMSLLMHHSLVNNAPTPKKSEIKQLGIAAILHDIGKSKWPKYLYTKKDRLTNDEKKEIQLHPIYGIELCGLMNLDNIITNVVLFHHEKLDGSGYPSGTKNINFYSCIVGISDMFSAMTCDRPYRPRFSTFDALKNLKNQSDTGKIDKKLTATFIKLISTNRFQI